MSGDKDYLETVKAVKANGLRVEIVSWGGALSRDLAEEASGPIIYLDDLRAKIELKAAVDAEAERLQETEKTKTVEKGAMTVEGDQDKKIIRA